MKNARILLAILLLAGFAKIAFSQEAAQVAEKQDAVVVEIKEEAQEAVANMVNAAVEVVEEATDVIVNAVN